MVKRWGGWTTIMMISYSYKQDGLFQCPAVRGTSGTKYSTGRSGNTGEVVNKRRMRARREGNKFRSMSGWRKIGCAGVVVTRLTSVRKFAYSEKKLLTEWNCWRNLLTISKSIVSRNLLTKFAYWEIKFAYGDCLFYVKTYQFSNT